MKDINLNEFLEKIEQKETFVVDFYADWCDACKDMTPVIDSVEQTSNIPFYKANIDTQPELKERAKIKAIPMLVMYKNGRMREFIYGMSTIDVINKKLRMITT